MYYMPTTLRVHSEIIIQGEMERNGRLNIALRNDSYNICQLDVFYPTDGQYEDRIDILPIRDDSQSYAATEYFEGAQYGRTIFVTLNRFWIQNHEVTREPRQSEDRYNNTQLNGGAPPWQTTDQSMYRIPTELNINNEIVIRGVLPSNRLLNVELRNDSDIIAQMKVNENSEIVFSPRGEKNLFATEIFVDTTYLLQFRLNNGLSIYVDDNHIESIPLNHAVQDIKYLTVNGEVKELRFIFNI